MQATIELLQKAKEILETHEWIQGFQSLDSNRSGVNIDSPKACAFCAQGAICRAAFELGQPHTWFSNSNIQEAVKVLRLEQNCQTVWQWNDKNSRTKQEILDGFQRAIDRC